jgi:hypothetical protein
MDRVAHELLHRCATAFDRGRWDDLALVFAADAVLDFGELGGTREGLPAITRFCRRALERFDAVQHFISNIVVTGTVSESYFLAYHLVDGVDEPFVVGGRYRDELIETAAGWRIASRTLTPVWQRGDPTGQRSATS